SDACCGSFVAAALAVARCGTSWCSAWSSASSGEEEAHRFEIAIEGGALPPLFPLHDGRLVRSKLIAMTRDRMIDEAVKAAPLWAQKHPLDAIADPTRVRCPKCLAALEAVRNSFRHLMRALRASKPTGRAGAR